MIRLFERPMRLVLWLIALSAAAYAVERWGRLLTRGDIVEAWWAIVASVLILVSHAYSAECLDGIQSATKAKTIDAFQLTWSAGKFLFGVAIFWSAAGAILAWRWL